MYLLVESAFWLFFQVAWLRLALVPNLVQEHNMAINVSKSAKVIQDICSKKFYVVV